MAAKGKKRRLLKVAKELNVGTATITRTLSEKGFEIDNKPTAKLTDEMYKALLHEFQSEKLAKEEAEKIELGKSKRETINIDDESVSGKKKREEGDEILIKNVSGSDIDTKKEKKKSEDKKKEKDEEEVIKGKKDKLDKPKVVGKVDLEEKEEKDKEKKKKKGKKKKKKKVKFKQKDKGKKSEKVKSDVSDLEGPKVVGKIDLTEEEKKEKERQKKKEEEESDEDKKSKKLVASSSDEFVPKKRKKRKKKRIKKKDKKKKKRKKKKQPKVSEEEVESQMKDTLSKLSSKKSKGLRQKRKRAKKEKEKEEAEKQAEKERTTLEVTEFISANELANMMDISVNDLITTCMNLGVVVSINQRLDAELIELVADEFGYDIDFVDVKEQAEVKDEEEEEDDPEDLEERPPIVTVMGHVDHGKTKLLDYIRQSDIAGGEKGGITQHIGAYSVTTQEGKKIAFLDTPGHEAFTAMRARGAKLTDVAVIVVAADEGVKPQTKEAISHAQAAGVSMIFAINKIDKPEANPEKVKKELSQMDILIEEWGGKYQSQEISAKTGENIDELLEKILVEAELLELKANPNKKAKGTVIEATLDKGKGYVATLLVQAGTLKKTDFILAGAYSGRVRAMFDQHGKEIEAAGPSTPVQILGLDGAPQAGDPLKVYEDEQQAKKIAKEKQQIIREQGLRAQKHITLDEIGRRLALGNFQELNIIVKGDVDGSVEALSDSLQKLSTEEIQVNIVHKGVGQISESDVLLAAASDALIIGFQVRPSRGARKLAEKENIEIRLYSVIYNAIEEVESAMEGMLAPKVEEEVLGTAEIKEIFKISKVGTVAGCYVHDGKISRNAQVRVIRDGVVIYTGELGSLKRYKNDAKEIPAGMECGLNIENFNDIKVGDEVEAFTEVEKKRTLEQSKSESKSN